MSVTCRVVVRLPGGHACLAAPSPFGVSGLCRVRERPAAPLSCTNAIRCVWLRHNPRIRIKRVRGLHLTGVAPRCSGRGLAPPQHLGPTRCQLRQSGDPQNALCRYRHNAFHVVKWAGERLDELRRRLAGELRAAGKTDEAAALGKGMRALRKDTAALSPGQRQSLAQIAAGNQQLYKANPMNEQLREVFKATGSRGKALLAGLIAWCQRSRIPEFTALATSLKRFRQLIWNTLGHAVSNGRAEAINTQLAALTARARGFHGAEAFIAMAELTCGGLCPDLRGR